MNLFPQKGSDVGANLIRNSFRVYRTRERNGFFVSFQEIHAVGAYAQVLFKFAFESRTKTMAEVSPNQIGDRFARDICARFSCWLRFSHKALFLGSERRVAQLHGQLAA